jgi:predicted metal-binding protein
MAKRPSTLVVRPRRADPVLICKKCLARCDKGKQFKRSLKSELKRRSHAQSLKRPRVITTSCFGICPKRAVVLANGATLQRGEYVLAGDSDSVSDAVAILIPLDDAGSPAVGESKRLV